MCPWGGGRGNGRVSVAVSVSVCVLVYLLHLQDTPWKRWCTQILSALW